MKLFYVARQQKESLISIHHSRPDITDEEIIKHIRVQYKKVRIRKVIGKVGSRHFYLSMKMNPTQIQVMDDYLNFVFN